MFHKTNRHLFASRQTEMCSTRQTDICFHLVKLTCVPQDKQTFFASRQTDVCSTRQLFSSRQTDVCSTRQLFSSRQTDMCSTRQTDSCFLLDKGFPKTDNCFPQDKQTSVSSRQTRQNAFPGPVPQSPGVSVVPSSPRPCSAIRGRVSQRH